MTRGTGASVAPGVLGEQLVNVKTRLVVSTAVESGALGARMTGGGFGGSAIALVRADAVDEVAQAVADAFADASLRAPAFLVATAEGPAA